MNAPFLTSRIQSHKLTGIDPLFPPIYFKSKWLDNLKSYVKVDRGETEFLDAAVSNLMRTAQGRLDGEQGLIAFNIRSKTAQNLPKIACVSAATEEVLNAAREQCFEEVPALSLLGADADAAFVLDVRNRYAHDGELSPKQLSVDLVRKAVIAICETSTAYISMIEAGQLYIGEVDNFDGLKATIEGAEEVFASSGNTIASSLKDDAAFLRDMTGSTLTI